jgi:hypothetical protein
MILSTSSDSRFDGMFEDRIYDAKPETPIEHEYYHASFLKNIDLPSEEYLQRCGDALRSVIAHVHEKRQEFRAKKNNPSA